MKHTLTAKQKADLAEVIEAAGRWADELTEHIAKGSEEYGDQESADNQRESARKIIEAGERLELLADPKTCEWFHACERPAVTLVSHPILNTVPTCQPCADRIERLK